MQTKHTRQRLICLIVLGSACYVVGVAFHGLGQPSVDCQRMYIQQAEILGISKDECFSEPVLALELWR